ncbi:uncharacterized protein BDZ99DRAFT_384075 [Mytilinidion resinicola]|uniref:C6 transcription factor RegA n=1 Tax=Mytilinidion resinicola TaxID=574789 RepID=A0A6A6YUT7_9PEZI|nr:uncharacterized protein BDZ99DRAFT_384075 [Mytilinidion resinicola]KAF2812726.1 hypothetical protein BDZ99DRAFT_384075 [Mytilinidion resinicola]
MATVATVADALPTPQPTSATPELAPALPQNRARPARGAFQCGTCSQSYTRLDHLARHVRSHTQEKPYACHSCEKRFSRVDLLRRHAALHSEGTAAEPTKRRRIGTSAAGAVRVSQACAACADNHLKCEDQKPCRRCRNKNIACHVPEKASATDTIEAREEECEELALDPALPVLHHPSESMPFNNHHFAAHSSPAPFHRSLTAAQQPEMLMHSSERTMMSPTVDGLPDAMNMPFTDSMDLLPTTFMPTLPSGTRTPRGVFDFGLETNLEFSDSDLGFLNSYNTRVPFEFENQCEAVNLPRSHTVNDDVVGGTAPNTASPLQTSIWRFVPNSRDHAAAEQPHLSLPAAESCRDSPASRVGLGRRATTEKLDMLSRDRILGIVLSQVKPHISRALSSFPSVDLLDSLLQYFLTAPFSGASSWFHAASFCPRKSRPELLAAMAAAGAVLTPDMSLRKLGFAIQEIVRNYLPTVWENNNAEIRDLELAQAFMLQLEIGLWSGNSRKIEIAESFQQPLLTMLRRGGKFRRSSYPAILLQPEDNNHTLSEKWHTWIKQESFKRLVFHLLQHDAQSSVALLVSPLISYAEVGLPLPESQSLWTATSAEDWKALYLTNADNASIRIPALTDCINDLELLESSSHLTDVPLSCRAFLHALWGMVWEYRQLALLFRGQPHFWDGGLVMMSRYQELIKILDHFRLGYAQGCNLLLELILMHMHLSLDDVQLFAGLEGPDEARRVYQSMGEWTRSKASRQAVWHAGQVVRAAKSLQPQHLRDINAIAVYHASLAFWAYALASRIVGSEKASVAGQSTSSNPRAAEMRMVWLDDAETVDTQKFVALKRGSPALRDVRPGTQAAPLEAPSAVIEVLIETMRQNHIELDRPKPPLVENLIQLMEALRDTAK